MYKINNAKQVMKQEAGDSYELWVPVGTEKEVQLIQPKEYQWMKFDLEQEQYIPDTKNTTPIVIDADGVPWGDNEPQEYIPVNGKVVIA